MDTTSDQTIETELPEFLKLIGTDRPLLAESILRAHENRQNISKTLANGPFADAIEELLAVILHHANLCRQDSQLEKLAVFVYRVADEFRAAFECLLSGMHTLVGDLMRIVMEAEYLIDEFTLEPHRISDWLSLDSKGRWRDYRPVKLRERRAARLAMNLKDMIDHTEYCLHSTGIHFSPETVWYADRGISAKQGDPAITICIGEILEHGRRFIVSLNALCATHCSSTPTKEELSERLKLLSEAREMIYLRIEVWNELRGQDEDEVLERLFPEDGPLDLLAILRHGHAKIIASEIRNSMEPKQTDDSSSS